MAQQAIADPTRQQEDTQSISLIFESFEQGFVLDMKDVEVFYFIEDIFANCMTGVLRFRDLYGFAEFAPLTGNQEKIHVVYGTKKDITLTFDVWKVNEIVPTSGKGVAELGTQNVIELILVDQIYDLFTNQRWSRSWQQDSVSNIVNHLARYMLDSDIKVLESSNEEIDFVMPWWTAKQAINWLSKRGKSIVTGKSGYLFYNSSRGLNFVTIEKLLQGSPRKTGDTSGVYLFQNPQNIWYINNVLGFSLVGVDNSFLRWIRGGTKFGYDFTTKSLLEGEFELTDGLDNITVLGRKTLYSDIGTPRADYKNEGESDSDILEVMWHDEFNKRYTLQQGIKIIVKGHEERFAGSMLEIEWPSTEKELIHNKQMKGLYLVRSVTHEWSHGRPGWIQKLVLLKNGYTDSRNKNLLNASRKNVYGSEAEGILGRLG